jgi:hypothetical protein
LRLSVVIKSTKVNKVSGDVSSAMLVVTTYAFELHAENKMCCRILHHLIWYKSNTLKENAASTFVTLMVKVK